MSDSSKPAGTFSLEAPTNAQAELSPSDYEICQRSGIRVRAGTLVREWTGLRVRPEDWEPRHPQDFVRQPSEHRRRGPVSPEPDDVFVGTNEVTTDDL